MFKPIAGRAEDWKPREEGVVSYFEHNQEEITKLLEGRKIEKVDDEHLLLDNGTVIKAIGRDGGCACNAGCYDLSELNGVDNIITRVEFDYAPTNDYSDFDGIGYYRIFVYAENQKINLMQFDGTDGNGYYGTGFEILVRTKEN